MECEFLSCFGAFLSVAFHRHCPHTYTRTIVDRPPRLFSRRDGVHLLRLSDFTAAHRYAHITLLQSVHKPSSTGFDTLSLVTQPPFRNALLLSPIRIHHPITNKLGDVFEPGPLFSVGTDAELPPKEWPTNTSTIITTFRKSAT